MNFVLLIGKSYIWVCRHKDNKPAIAHFKQILNNKYDTETYAAKKRKTINISLKMEFLSKEHFKSFMLKYFGELVLFFSFFFLLDTPNCNNVVIEK